ncbi:MAG: hypothetical protein ACLUN9_04895 [Enterocloster aldenensis]|uniref:hypothetical protein n=1 Tax=Enterocloster sp. TaxID=2719315 RepID=UPI0039A18D4E
MIKGAKSIAELAVRDWCRSIGLDMRYIKLGMDGNEAMIEDDIGNTLRLVYDNDTKSVYVKE